MLSDGELHDNIARANHAKRLLADEMFMGACKQARDELVAKMVATGDQKELVNFHHELKGLERVLRRLNNILDSGKMAVDELEFRKKAKR